MNNIDKITLFLLLNLSLALTQSVTNVVARQEGDEVIVTYDLVRQLAENEEITFGYSANGGNTWQRITNATGDLGKNIPFGKSKIIRWLISPDYANQEVRFKIKALNLTNMIWVEGGTFQMGEDNGFSDQGPVHMVTVSGFYIDKYEVTQAEYRRVMGKKPSYFKNCYDCPVESVTWIDAVAYAKKVGKRLPTEAEWEYAARGGNQSHGYKYAGSDNLDDVAWYYDNSGHKTHPVGQKKPNELGLYDMSGNVEEWCADWYKVYLESPSVNPTGPNSGRERIVRGGCYTLNAEIFCRTGSRNASYPGYSLVGQYVGFRCIQDF